jgi:hypothetical protein
VERWMKKPWLAAVLNIIPGVGYLYLNSKRIFGWLLIASVVASILDMFDPAVVNSNYNGGPATPWIVLSFGLLLAAFIVDGYYEAKRTASKPTK